MKKYRVHVNKGSVMAMVSTAYVDDGDDPTVEILREVWQCLSTDINVTIGGVTMFVAAWEDPDHWATDWAEKLGIDYEEVEDAVAALIDSAEEE